MPKLPEIRYSTNVQSLGREDISAPGRLAAARVGAAQSIFEGVKEVERTFAAAEYTKQMSQARNSINELYDAVVSKEAFTSSEIPEFVTGINRHETVTLPDGTEIIQERIIPASEVREQWFKQGMQNITNGVIKGTKTPTARTRISNELKTSIGPAAYNQLLTYNRAAMRKEQLAILDASVQDAVVNGDRLAVEETLYRFLLSGTISKDDYETRILVASQDLDIEAYSKSIYTAEDLGDLETIWSDLALNKSPTKAGTEPSDMTAAQRNSLRTSLKSQQAVFTKEKKETQATTARDGIVRLNDNSLTNEWIDEQMTTGNLEYATALALMNSRDSGSAGKYKRDEVVGGWKKRIQSEMYYTELGTQTTDVRQDLWRNIVTSNLLNGEEQATLLSYVESVESDLRSNPEVKQAISSMRAITGLPEIGDGIGMKIAQAMGDYEFRKNAYVDFSNALFQHIDEFGADANALEFVQKNKEAYNFANYAKNDEDRFRTDHPDLISQSEPYNKDLIMYNLYERYQTSDSVSDEFLSEIWVRLYGSGLDLNELDHMRIN